jgi:hypothetical protein
MLKKGRLWLHYLYDTEESSENERFVYSCSGCSCILNVCMTLEPASDTVESLGNRCPGCGSALEASVSCRSARVPDAWLEISRSMMCSAPMVQAPSLPAPAVPDRTAMKEAGFRTAASLREFSFNFGPLDALVGHFIDPSWSVVFTGRCANLVAEFLCFRAQLPREAGGSDSSVVLIDGGNRSDLYLFSSFAKLYGVAPKKALERVVTSRAFTVYQLANLVVNELAGVVDMYGARVVMLTDALGVMSEGSGLRDEEAKRLAHAVRYGIDAVRREKEVRTFVTLLSATQHDRVMTDEADVLVDFQESGPRIKGTLLKHPLRRQPSSHEFSMHDLIFHRRSGGQEEEEEEGPGAATARRRKTGACI